MTVLFESTPLGQLPDLGPTLRAARSRPAGIDQRLAPALLGSAAAAAARQRLLEGARCVTSGQQPGLFTGPLFTVYKAISAVAVARRLERELGEPVVPVFWVAGDDHDFAEANHCTVLNGQGEPLRLELRSRPPESPMAPLYREPVGPDIGPILDQLRAGTPESEFRPAVLELLGRHYRPDTTLADAFAGFLADLLGPLGLVVFLPTHPSAKQVMAPWIRRALHSEPALGEALARHASELESRGQPTPVPTAGGVTGVMVEGRLGRDRLLLQDGRFVGRRSGESWTPAEMVQLLDQEPQRFSPNVLLRPVIEAAILPTLTYLAGPGELDYLPQADPVYAALNVVPQARIPRWSGRVIEGRVQRVLEKYHLGAEQLGKDGELEGSLAREELPPEAQEALAALRDGIEREYNRLLGPAVAIDNTLKKPVESARNSALVAVAGIEKRLVAHLKRQDETMGSQVARARSALFPLGQPQERVLNVTSFLIRYGNAFLTEAATAIQQWADSLERSSGEP